MTPMKKSARLAEKRKLREEAGPPAVDEDYYFTPLTRVNRLTSASTVITSVVAGRQTASPVLVKERLSPSSSFRSKVRTPTPTQQGPTPPVDVTVLPLPTASVEVGTLNLGGKDARIPENECCDTVAAPSSSNLTPVTGFGMIRYVDRVDGTTLSFPPGMDYPLPAKSTCPPPPPVTLCVIPGCSNRKKYSCSKTKAPLCSLECYNKNLANVTVTTPMT